MPTYNWDLVDGTVVSRNVSGFSATRRVHVEGLSGDRDERVYRALNSDAIPNIGSAHPTIPYIYVQNISAEPTGANGVYITIEYAPHAYTSGSIGESVQPQTNVGATVQPVETEFDIYGEQMVLKYERAGSDPDGAAISIKKPDQGVRAEVQTPCATLQFTRREPKSPIEKLGYVGAVNDKLFHGHVAGAWLCTSISGISPDGGQTWDVSYEFQLGPETKYVTNENRLATGHSWLFTAVYTDPETGEPIAGAAENLGKEIKTWEVYSSADFSRLDIPVR